MNKKYKLIISDFDGTFLRSDQTISEENVKAVRSFVENGGIFALSSGRSLQSILPIARKMGLKGLLACFNGSVVADIDSGEIILENTFSTVETLEICLLLKELGLYTQAYKLDSFFASERNFYLEYYEKLCGVKAIVPEEGLIEYIRSHKVRSVKIISVLPVEDRDRYYKIISEKLKDKAYVTSGGSNLIEICVKGFSKGTAVQLLAERYGIQLTETLAVGDALNDLPMLETAGLGVAVKNAEKALQEKMYVYEYSNDEDAVAKLIKEYGYTGEK